MLMGGGTGTTPSATTPATEKVEPTMSTPVSAPEVADKMDVDSQAPAPESEKAQMEAVESQSQTQGESVHSILQTEEFWSDVKGFLAQRLRDEKEGERLAGMFREAWKRS